MGRRRRPPSKARPLPMVPGKKALRAEKRRQAALEREAAEQVERERQARLARMDEAQEQEQVMVEAGDLAAIRRPLFEILLLTHALRAR